MARISGTSGNDFIHRRNDGQISGGGNEIARATAGKDTIDGNAGSDAIFGDGGADRIIGGTGNDSITGGQGADNLSGGIGRDSFNIQDVSEITGLVERIDGGADVDGLNFQIFNAQGAVDLSKAALSGIEELHLVGNNLTLKAAQLGGFSFIRGSGLADRIIVAGGGTVNLTGADIAGIDEIRGSASNDRFTLTGVTAGQTVNTLGGADTVSGTGGADLIDSSAGNDSVSGGDGNDVIAAGDGLDRIVGGDGDDSVTGGASRDQLGGGEGKDIFAIRLVSDISGLVETIAGGADLDTIDFLSLGAIGNVDMTKVKISSVEQILLLGNDARFTSAQIGSFSSINGAGFTERVIITDAGIVDLTGAQIQSIEEIRGSAAANQLVLTDVLAAQTVDLRGGRDVARGGRAGDAIDGGDGNDQLFGNQGGDSLKGGQDTDKLFGGTGNDSFQIEGVSDISGLAETVNGGADTDTLDFKTFNAAGKVNLTKVVFSSIEVLNLQGNDVTITAAQLSTFDTINGSGLTDRIILSAAGTVNLAGSDIIGIDEFRGTGGADRFNFNNVPQGQTVSGLAGNDSIRGGSANDVLDGGDGADTLLGGNGTDVIQGGNGKDVLTGEDLADRFDFLEPLQAGNGASRDVITDFRTAVDVINLGSIDSDSSVFGNQSFAFIGGNAFGNIAGQLRYSGGILQGDTNGDSAADFQIELTGAPPVAIGDIVL